jgi:CxxC motif-containing protein (DUF1111 family)
MSPKSVFRPTHYLSALIAGFLSFTLPARAQAIDPGPRGGAPGAGNAISGISSDAQLFFAQATRRFVQVDSVLGLVRGEPGVGLGPGYNLDSCGGCHIHPATGGSSPSVNPQVDGARRHGAHNILPSFITSAGPIREVRFLHNPDGSTDGQVHELFTIAGRIDATGCTDAQPDFAGTAAAGNLAFRIPTALYGLGLVESVPDAALIAAKAAANGAQFGVSGHFNHSPDDGAITRFGWKAQIKSLLMFSGLAYNLEQGVTNELFPVKHDQTPGCQYNPLPEDRTNLRPSRLTASHASAYSSDIVNFAGYIRLLAPPTPIRPTGVTQRGANIFVQIGCAACHIPSLVSGTTPEPAMSNVTFFPYSDFALHAMGAGLQDGITQGEAAANEFRTAPLWGIGQRLFLLHDGRTSDLVTAINDHASPGSEANTVIGNWQKLNLGEKQSVLDFLRSL